MNFTRRSFITFSALVALIHLVPAVTFASSFALGPGSTLWLTGDSTLHPYASTATILNVSGQWTATPPADLPTSLLAQKGSGTFELSIPVTGLRSGEKMLDKNMVNTLKGDKFPNIVFKLTKYTVASAPASEKAGRLAIEGTLSIAGVEKPIQLDAQVRTDGTDLWIQGEQLLKMTDFEIKPPKLMLGALKVKNEVVVHYVTRLQLKP